MILYLTGGNTYEKLSHHKNGDKWNLKIEGGNRASIVPDTKKEILKMTSEFMSNKTGSVKIHKEDGTIQEERTFQRKDDPTESKG